MADSGGEEVGGLLEGLGEGGIAILGYIWGGSLRLFCFLSW